MVNIGNRPVLWHVMKYYAHFGYKDFIICLGYKAEVIKDYFLNYHEWVSNDFVLTNGGRGMHLLSTDIDDWTITFVDTGLNTSIGERLKAVEPYLEGEEVFLANYADGLSDLPLPSYIDRFLDSDNVASFLAVHSTQSWHVANFDESGVVSGMTPLSQSDILINGGYFIFRREIFSYLHEGEDLVFEPFERLIAAGKLMAHKYEGFWEAMDTFKDKQALDALYERNSHAPWEVWKHENNSGGSSSTLASGDSEAPTTD
jgi:glucose-1-phosphate cytidylyltransferase